MQIVVSSLAAAGCYRCLWKKHSSYASLGHAIRQQKLLSSPEFGAFQAKLSTRPLIRRSFFFTRGWIGVTLQKKQKEALAAWHVCRETLAGSWSVRTRLLSEKLGESAYYSILLMCLIISGIYELGFVCIFVRKLVCSGIDTENYADEKRRSRSLGSGLIWSADSPASDGAAAAGSGMPIDTLGSLLGGNPPHRCWSRWAAEGPGWSVCWALEYYYIV